MKDDDKKNNTKNFEKVWKSIRKDGAYVEAGENDNVIVQKLEANKDAYGIFGYSFLEENASKLKGVPIEGVDPTYDTISSGKYKGSRPLFVYVKKQHVGVDARHRQVRRRVRVGEGDRRRTATLRARASSPCPRRMQTRAGKPRSQ